MIKEPWKFSCHVTTNQNDSMEYVSQYKCTPIHVCRMPVKILPVGFYKKPKLSQNIDENSSYTRCKPIFLFLSHTHPKKTYYTKQITQPPTQK